jgi:hypothetical protein
MSCLKNREGKMPHVGIFWVYKGKVLGKAIDAAEGEERVPGLVDSPDSHVTYWENNADFLNPFPELRGSDYETIPRGRVLYSKSERMAIVYMDKTLFNKKAKGLLMTFFGLEQMSVSWRTDEHYTTSKRKLERLFK